MAHAFVIDWKYFDCRGDTVINVGSDRSRTKGKYCDFKFQRIGDDWLKMCYYTVQSVRLAGDLCRLMQQVSNFQLFNFIEQSLDYEFERDGDWGSTEWRDELKMFALSYDSSDVSRFYHYDNSEHRMYLSQQLPFSISEFDTEQIPAFEPCYFCQEYKIHDKKGVPLHLVVILEKIKDEQNVHNQDNNLEFNYRMKFVGSGYSLSQFVAKIPMCEDEQVYNKKVEDYKRVRKGYYDEQRVKICHMLSPKSGFWKNMTKYYDKYTNPHWSKCDPIRNGTYCKHYDEYFINGSFIKRCYYNHCPFYSIDHDKNTHSGNDARQLFEKAFGPEIMELVKNNNFTKDRWSLLPDVGDVGFIKAFNALMSYEMKFENSGFCIDYFQDKVVEKRIDEMHAVIARIQEWTKDPNKWTDKKLYDMALKSQKKSK